MQEERERTDCARRLRAVASRNPTCAILADGLAKGIETGQDAFGNRSKPGDLLLALHALKGMVCFADMVEVDAIARDIAKFAWR